MKRKEDIVFEDLRKHIVTFRTDEEVAYFTNLSDIHWGLCNRELFIETFNYLMSIPNMYVGIGEMQEMAQQSFLNLMLQKSGQ